MKGFQPTRHDVGSSTATLPYPREVPDDLERFETQLPTLNPRLFPPGSRPRDVAESLWILKN